MRSFLIHSAAILALAAGCGHASIWSQDARGGVLALHGSEEPAMEDAVARMVTHCGEQGYQVVGRDTVVVGQTSDSGQTTDYGENRTTVLGRPVFGAGKGSNTRTHGQVSTSSTSTSQNLNEVRLTYRCGGDEPAPAPPPVP